MNYKFILLYYYLYIFIYLFRYNKILYTHVLKFEQTIIVCSNYTCHPNAKIIWHLGSQNALIAKNNLDDMYKTVQSLKYKQTLKFKKALKYYKQTSKFKQTLKHN